MTMTEIPKTNSHDTPALQRVDRLLHLMGVDQHPCTIGDELKTAICALIDESSQQGQVLAGRAIAAILAGDLLVLEEGGGLRFKDTGYVYARGEHLDEYITR
jgi:hypothetical protein